MIKRSFALIFLFISQIFNAQNLSEVLSLSMDKPSGTARFESMGGAFGSLGGDLSSININPAGGAVFIDNEYGFTISGSNTKNNTLFFNNDEENKNF